MNYKVYDDKGQFVMTAPIETLRRVFRLADAAVDRVKNECSIGCQIHFNYHFWGDAGWVLVIAETVDVEAVLARFAFEKGFVE